MQTQVPSEPTAPLTPVVIGLNPTEAHLLQIIAARSGQSLEQTTNLAVTEFLESHKHPLIQIEDATHTVLALLDFLVTRRVHPPEAGEDLSTPRAQLLACGLNNLHRFASDSLLRAHSALAVDARIKREQAQARRAA